MRPPVRITLIAVGLLLGSCSFGLEPDPRDVEIRHSLAARELARLNLSHGGFESLLDTQTAVGLRATRPLLETVTGHELSETENDRLRDSFRRAILEVYPEPLWEAAIAEVYMKHLTVDDIEGILDFYDTPAGAKLLRLHSTLERETLEAGEKLMQTHSTEFGRRVGVEFREVFK